MCISLSQHDGTPVSPAKEKRKYSCLFFLPSVNKIDGNRISVCQKMFLGTLGYKTDEVIKTVQDTSDNIDILQKDMRGKHAPPHKTPDKDEVFINTCTTVVTGIISNLKPSLLFVVIFMSILCMTSSQ